LAEDITKIPESELLADLKETEDEIFICEWAIEAGVYTYGDGEKVSERLRVNEDIERRILAELERREGLIAATTKSAS